MGESDRHRGDIWTNLDSWFKDGFPFLKLEDPAEWMDDPGRIDKMVEQTLRSFATKGDDHPSHDISVKPGFILAKITLPKNTDPLALRAYVSAVKLQIEGLPDERKLSIPLPDEVSATGVRAVCRDRLLTVRMPKKKSGKGRQIGIVVK